MEQENQSLFDLKVDQQSISYLGEAARWAKFIAIIGFVFCGLMVMGSFFLGTMLSTMLASTIGGYSGIGGGFITFFYLIFAAIWFIPCLFLYRFGAQMQVAVKSNQQERLNYSLGNLKSYFKYIAVLFIIMLSIYALAIIGGIVTAIAMH